MKTTKHIVRIELGKRATVTARWLAVTVAVIWALPPSTEGGVTGLAAGNTAVEASAAWRNPTDQAFNGKQGRLNGGPCPRD